MKRNDIKKISQTAQDAIHAMRSARAANIEAQQPAALPELKVLADRSATMHADALSETQKLAAALKTAEVLSTDSAVTTALDKVQAANTSAQKLNLEAGQALAAAAGAPAPAAVMAALIGLVGATKLADDEAVARLQDLEAAFKWSPEYEAAEAGVLPGWIKDLPLGKWLTGGVIVLIALILLWQIGDAISGKGPLLENLARIEFARGLITFLLSVGTIFIAVLLVVGVMLSDGKEESDKKFNRAKEVLMVLIGIFGTILGFYFGTATTSPASPLGLSPLAIARSADGSTTTIAGVISGGKAPYLYGITFENDKIPAIKDQESKDGVLAVTITNAPDGKPSGYTITISDSGTNRFEYSAKDEQHIKGK